MMEGKGGAIIWTIRSPRVLSLISHTHMHRHHHICTMQTDRRDSSLSAVFIEMFFLSF